MFIGNKEIKEMNGEKVIFTDDTSVEYSEEYIKYLTTDEAIDIDELHIKKILKIQSDILRVLKDAGATKNEIGEALDGVKSDLIRHEKNVLCNLLGAKSYLDISFREINRLALEIQDKEFYN